MIAGQPPTRLMAALHGVTLEYLVTGAGAPVTIFAHGLAGDIATTRPLASGVVGTRAFLHFRGHGRSSAGYSAEDSAGYSADDRAGDGAGEANWTYARLAEDLRAVADKVGARRALGVSMGAGALVRLLAETPDRFDRAVLYLPAVADEPRGSAARARVEALASPDTEVVRRAVAEEIPAEVRDSTAAAAFVAQRVAALRNPELMAGMRSLVRHTAVADVAELKHVGVPTLVIGCVGDPLHPATVAERLAAALPEATLHVYDEPGALWRHRADLRGRIATFLNR